MEHGYFHPAWGYWQTISAPSESVLATYPEGTTEVGLPPTSNHRYENGQWVVAQPVPPTPEQTEALRSAAYRTESDPLFFKAQRGEATMSDWLAKVAEIKARYL